MKGKSLSRVQLLATPWTAAYQAPPSMGFFQARVLEWGAIAFSDQPGLGLIFLSREGRDLGVALQAPPGSQASSRGEAKDSALLPSRDVDILVPPEWPQGSPASSSLLREDS